MSADVVFEEPPRRGLVAEAPWTEWAAALDQRPGTWARVRLCETSSQAGSLVQAFRKGKTPLGTDDYEARSGQLPDGTHGVWMRRTSPIAMAPEEDSES